MAVFHFLAHLLTLIILKIIVFTVVQLAVAHATTVALRELVQNACVSNALAPWTLDRKVPRAHTHKYDNASGG